MSADHFEWVARHSFAMNGESCDWLHMTGKGDDNMTYEQPAKKSIYLGIYYVYTTKDAPLEAHHVVAEHIV